MGETGEKGKESWYEEEEEEEVPNELSSLVEEVRLLLRGVFVDISEQGVGGEDKGVAGAKKFVFGLASATGCGDAGEVIPEEAMEESATSESTGDSGLVKSTRELSPPTPAPPSPPPLGGVLQPRWP